MDSEPTEVLKLAILPYITYIEEFLKYDGYIGKLKTMLEIKKKKPPRKHIFIKRPVCEKHFFPLI